MKRHEMFGALTTTEEFWVKRVESASIADHPTVRGDVAENAWRELLGEYLPARYRVGGGFVVSADGMKSGQIDCIIYDNTYTPKFFGEHGMLYIPIEAVYAVFEVKPEVTRANILYASGKARSVRALRRTTAPYVGDGQERAPKPPIHIIGGLLADRISGWGQHAQTMAQQQPSPDRGGNGAIDVVLTAKKGGADFFESGFPATKPRIYPQKGGLMVGVLRLIRALQTQGTVPAVDLNDWLYKFETNMSKK